jgi:hypothetical protein
MLPFRLIQILPIVLPINKKTPFSCKKTAFRVTPRRIYYLSYLQENRFIQAQISSDKHILIALEFYPYFTLPFVYSLYLRRIF